jgi:hypothetical protein
MRILKAGVLYFALVFGAGFVLGPIRILWVVPKVGVRTAELLEAPIMFVVIVVTARWLMRRHQVSPATVPRLGVGFMALGLLLATEFTLVLWLRGLSVREYLAGRDPVAETAYVVMLVVFAIMPLFVARR